MEAQIKRDHNILVRKGIIRKKEAKSKLGTQATEPHTNLKNSYHYQVPGITQGHTVRSAAHTRQETMHGPKIHKPNAITPPSPSPGSPAWDL